ncbi:hypothetical protein [Enterococcus silesiacus]|nr:hypothetical protein [Enterococcus silesiacus]
MATRGREVTVQRITTTGSARVDDEQYLATEGRKVTIFTKSPHKK